MLLLCGGLAASYYSFDIPSATETALQTAFLGSGANATADTCVNGTSIPGSDSASADAFNNNFNLLYSLYAWPNIALPFLGGYLSDRMGVRLMGVVFMGLLCLGQLLTALGSSYIAVNTDLAWYTMFAGRTVFGFGGESLSVAQSAMIASYFQGKELAFALGVNVALARMGSVLNNEISAVIAQNAPVSLAYWVGFAAISGGLVAMVAAFYIDVAAENQLRAARGQIALQDAGLAAAVRGLLCGCCQRPAVAGKRAAGGDAAGLLALDLDRPARKGSEEDLDGVQHAEAIGGGTGIQDVLAAPTEEIHFGAVLRFPPVFWFLTLSCLTVYICVLTFNNNAPTFITQKYLSTQQPLWQVCDDEKSGWFLQANTIQSTVYACSAFATPAVGYLTDVYGLRAILNVLAAAAITGVHSVLAWTSFYPVLPLVALGLCYSIYAAALWPSIALVIAPHNQATAYGLVTAVQNLGQALSPMAVAQLMPDARCTPLQTCIDGWNGTERFFVYLGCAGMACGVMLNLADRFCARHPVLNRSAAAAKALAERESQELAADAEKPLLLAV